MKQHILLGQTDYSTLVFVVDPAQTDGSGKTGLVAANLTASYSRVETDNDVTVTDVTSSVNNLAALTSTHNDWGWLEVSSTLAPGLYRFDIADAVFAAGAWSGVVYVMITTSAAAPSVSEFILVAYDQLNAASLGLTNLDATITSRLAPTVAARTLDVTTTGEAGIDWANIGAPTTTVNLSGTSTLALEPTTAGRKLDVTTGGEAGIDWANVGSPTTTVGLTGTTISTAQVVASVTGAVGSVTGAVGSVTGNVGGNVTGSVGSVVGAVGSVTGAVGSVTGNVGGNVVGSVGSVVGAVGSVTGAVGSVTGNVGGNVVGTVASVVGSVGGNVTGSVGSVATGGIAAASFAAGAIDNAAIASNAIGAAEIATGAITAAKFAASAIDAAALATDAVQEIRDAIFARAFSAAYGSLTFDQVMSVILATQAAKTSGGATTTFTIRNLADGADVIVATVDASGNRTAVTVTP